MHEHGAHQKRSRTVQDCKADKWLALPTIFTHPESYIVRFYLGDVTEEKSKMVMTG